MRAIVGQRRSTGFGCGMATLATFVTLRCRIQRDHSLCHQNGFRSTRAVAQHAERRYYHQRASQQQMCEKATHKYPREILPR